MNDNAPHHHAPHHHSAHRDAAHDHAEPARPGEDIVLGGGYTVTDLDRLAWKAAYGSKWRFLPLSERFDIAQFAIVERLLSDSDEPAEFWTVVRVGEKAISAHVEQQGRYRGVYVARSGVEPGTALPRFWRYWISASMPTRSPEDQIIELTALTQIWPRLTRPHRTVLEALAIHDDYRKAAESLGRPYHSFVSVVSTARQQFLRLWHQHEIPSAVWGHHRPGNKRADRARSITTVTIRRRERRRTQPGNRENADE